MKKIFLLIVFISINLTIVRGQDKAVMLTVSGLGKTQDEAKQNAFRSAIEQAFGTFISSITEILNDNLVKDEIISVSNGNIQKFEILSEIQMPDGIYTTTLKVIVSVNKLTTFCENKGIEVEFKGSLFAFNINQQILTENNEIKAIENMIKIVKGIAKKSFSYEISVEDPISVKGNNNLWNIPINISVKTNTNFNAVPALMYNTIKGLSLTKEETESYTKLGKSFQTVTFASDKNNIGQVFLRKGKSISLLLDLLYSFSEDILDFKIDNGLKSISFLEIANQQSESFTNHPILRAAAVKEGNMIIDINDTKFSLFLQDNGGYFAPSIFGPNLHIVYTYNMQDEPITPLNLSVIAKIREEISNPYQKDDNHGIKRSYNLTSNYQERKRMGIPNGSFTNPNFLFLNKLIKSNTQVLGLVISFVSFNENQNIIEIKLNDVRSLDELKKISGYKITPNN